MAISVRIYGILINEKKEVLLSDERRFGILFTKFPGGGLEEGEGIKDALKREFMEELSLPIEVGELIYLTDFFQPSAFNPNDQIISVYYFVHSQGTENISTVKQPFDFPHEEAIEVQRWKKITDLNQDDVTFPIDKIVVRHLKKNK